MAEEDKDMKTEEPTSKKKTEQFQKGNFAKAQEIGMVGSLSSAFVMILFMAQESAMILAEYARYMFNNLSDIQFTKEIAMEHIAQASQVLLQAVGPFAAVMAVTAVVANGLQSGFKLTLKRMEPSLTRFNPVAGFKKFFGKEVFMNFVFDVAKFFGIGAILYGVLDRILADPIFHTPVPVTHIGGFIVKTILELFALLIAFMIIIALLHFLFQKWRTHKDMMMTKQEVKDENKSSQGDQEIKGRQKQFAREILQKSMMRKVETADVVVTNPTHYAIALRYEQGKDAAPMIVAMGKGHIAKRIKAIAAEHGVPMVENRPVARMLYSIGRLDHPIPAELYTVIAEILSYVYTRHRYYYHRLKQRRLEERLAS